MALRRQDVRCICVVKWIFFLCELFIICLVLLTSKWDGKPKNQRLFSITLPKEHLNHPELLEVQKRYQLQLSVTFLSLLTACLLSMFLHFKFISMELFFFFLIIGLSIALPSYFYAKANQLVKEIKQNNSWEAGNYSHGIHEDEFWRYGQFYRNPFDTARTTTKRMGIGTTLNLAHKKQQRFFIVSLALTLLVTVLLCFQLFYMEVKTPSYRIETNTLYIDYPVYYYHVPIKDILSLRVIQELPPTLKSNGIATDSFSRGFFNVKGYGEVFLCIYNTGPYLLIETKEGTVIVNEITEEKTYELLEALDMVIPK